MKRYLKAGVILTSIFIAVSGCSSKKTPVSLEKAGTMTEEQLKEELEGLSHEEIVDVWGEAEASLSGMYGEVFPLDEGRTLTLYYEDDGNTVRDVKLGEVSQTFEGTIEEIYGSSAVVAVDEGFAIRSSGDKVSIMLNGDASMAQAGNRVRVSYSGAVMESYPLQLEKQNSIELLAREEYDQIPMVMVNGTLYLDTGRESTAEARCGVMDGEITSQVAQSESPTIDGQSNFGTGYGYQYGSADGTIEIYINDKWWIFATEEVRQKLQFPATEADTWSFTDAASIQVINGNNGERITFAKDTAEHDFQKILDLCQNLEKTTDTEENSRVGYNYCIIMNDNHGQWLHSITPYKDGYTVDDIFYKYSDEDTNRYDNASVRLLDYLGLLFYPAEDASEIIENPLAVITEFTESVNTLENVEMLMEKYKYTEGDLEIVNHSGKELQTGSSYDIQMKVDEKWYRLEQMYDVAWADAAYMLPNGQTTVLNTQWFFVYGALPAGSYRIVKEITDYRTPGDYDTYYVAAEFEIN